MSINAVSTADQYSALKKRMVVATGTGALIGGAVVAKDKQYLYRGLPSDKFVKSVSENLKEEMNKDEIMESAKINRFLEKVVDTDVDEQVLKDSIIDSTELSEAIKSNPNEKVEDAIARVFSQPDKNKVKEDLLNLQYKTNSNKKTGRTTSSRLLNANFDAKEQKFVKDNATSERLFGMLKKTAAKIQIKTVAIGAAVTGLIAGAVCLISTDAPGDKK